MKPKYIWNEDSKLKLLKFFHGNLLNKVATTVKQTTNAENKLKIINELLISAYNQCLKKQTRKSNANRKKQKTKHFDENCYRKRKDLNRLGILMCKFPNNVDIRNTYHNTKKNYRHMLRTNLRLQKERKLQRLHSLGSKVQEKSGKLSNQLPTMYQILTTRKKSQMMTG